MRMRRFGRHVRRAEPNQRAAFVDVIQLIKSGRFSVPYIADRTGHNEVTIRHWLNGSTQQPRIDTLLNVARLYGLKGMRTLCAMTPNQIARAERQKDRRVSPLAPTFRNSNRVGREAEVADEFGLSSAQSNHTDSEDDAMMRQRATARSTPCVDVNSRPQ